MAILAVALKKSWKGILFLSVLLVGVWGGLNNHPVWLIEQRAAKLTRDHKGKDVVQSSGKLLAVSSILDEQDSRLLQKVGQKLVEPPPVDFEIVRLEQELVELSAVRHYQWWSLWPAFVAVLLCFVLREPVIALVGGILAGGAVTEQYDVTAEFLIPVIGSPNGATIIVLYLWFLGRLQGLWMRTGAAAAFAEFVTQHFVRGPRSAKFVAWLLGVLFFQGGTLSTVLVGTTVRPIADKQRVSHEELAYVVDSTASPVALIVPFNAWPFYVQSFIFVAGVPFLATSADRIQFFFSCIPLFFYAWLAVGFTLLFCFDRLPFIGSDFKRAVTRSRQTGELDRPGATPLAPQQPLSSTSMPIHRAHTLEFLVPLTFLILTAVGTFFVTGRPQILWAFGGAVSLAVVWALLRGMPLRQLVESLCGGMGSVVYGSVVLLLAITIGYTSSQTGAGIFLVDLLRNAALYYTLPLALLGITMVISFATGTSFGTFAVSLPLGMPLAWALAVSEGLGNPELYVSVCFATMLCGSVFGDQCSPISDTTVLSSMATGCDLMDHVRTQIFPCLVAMAISVILWLLVVLIFCL